MARRKYRRRKLQDLTSQFQRFYCALKVYHYRSRMEEKLEISAEEAAEMLGKSLRSIQQIEEGEILPDPYFIRRCCRIFSETLDLRDRNGRPRHLRYQDFYGDESWKVEDFMRAMNFMTEWKNKLIVKVLATGRGRLSVGSDGKKRVVFDVAL